MPGYGLLDEDAGQGLLPWSWATERLATASAYWVAQRRATSWPTRAARSARATPHEAVVVEGTAERVTAPDELARLSAAYQRKYGAPPPDPAANPVFAVRPLVAFGHALEFAPLMPDGGRPTGSLRSGGQ